VDILSHVFRVLVAVFLHGRHHLMSTVFCLSLRALRAVILMKSENVSGTRRSNGPIFDLGQHKLFSCFLFRSIAWEIIYGKD
jgi:hypothetical protein